MVPVEMLGYVEFPTITPSAVRSRRSRPMDFSGWNCIPRQTRPRFSRKTRAAACRYIRLGQPVHRWQPAQAAGIHSAHHIPLQRWFGNKLPPSAAPPLRIGENSTKVAPSSAWFTSNTRPENRSLFHPPGHRIWGIGSNPARHFALPPSFPPYSLPLAKACCTMRPSTRTPARPC